MKLLFIHHTGLLGGGTLSCFDVINALKKDNHEILLYLPPGQNAARNYAKKKDIKLTDDNIMPITFGYYNGSSSTLRVMLKFIFLIKYHNEWIKLLNREKPDVVILNSLVQWPMIAILNRLGIKTVCFVRETLKGKRNNLINKVIAYYLNNLDGVSFLSDFDKSQWKLKNNVHNVVIPDLVDVRNFHNNIEKDQARVELGLEKDIFYVLFVGGFNKLKGTYTIVKSMDYLRKHNIVLLLIGDSGENLKDLKGIRKIMNNSQIRFVKIVYDFIKNAKLGDKIKIVGLQSNMNYWYSASDVVVFPAVEAHQARPIYEAGVFKKPVIVSDFPNYNEYLKDEFNGLVFNPNNSRNLADKILSLYTEPLLTKKIGEKNYEMTIEHHNSDKIYKTIRNFVNKI